MSGSFYPQIFWNQTTAAEVIDGGWVVCVFATQCRLDEKRVYAVGDSSA